MFTSAKDGEEKKGVDGLFTLERESREKRRIMRMRTSLLVGGDGDITKKNIFSIPGIPGSHFDFIL